METLLLPGKQVRAFREYDQKSGQTLDWRDRQSYRYFQGLRSANFREPVGVTHMPSAKMDCEL